MALAEVASFYHKAENYREMSGFVHMYTVYDRHTPVGRVYTRDLFQCSMSPDCKSQELYPCQQWTE